jgi:PIN domain nuclease of toxin-antitoxin system
MSHSQRLTLDAHTLIWYYHQESNIRLSQKAFTSIVEAEKDSIIFVPVVVLMEILWMLEKKKYPVNFDDLLQDLETNPAYKVIPLTMDIIGLMKNSPGVELFDRAIKATALITDSVLVSKDKEIRASGLNVIWSKREDISETDQK